MRYKIKLKKILNIIIILLISYVIYVTVDIYLYANTNEMTKSDAAIVLGAGVWGNKPSPVFEERIRHGIWLYKNGYVDKLIFTGGKGKNNIRSDSSIAKSYAVENLVPENDIFIEEQSTITQENISYAAKIIKENSMSAVIIVSDPLHMKRAMLMAEDYGLNAYSSPTPSTKYKTMKSKSLFMMREVFFYIGYNIYRLF
ncbi:MAG TPA: YdcF family protein [Pseudobacteroides sp.]|uniref:YdcF family protein n=1 Tax=Pseudobacteroides sp. TaxID=1968840 RepID=UPI002F95DC5B